MKNIRIWFEKVKTAKYISHLDVCRCMERAIHKAKLPFWYTQGYNPHVFLTITMPISLGYTGLREVMDVKLLTDDMPYDEILRQLNSGLPKDIHAYEITEPKMKPGAVAFSSYEIRVDSEDSSYLEQNFSELLSGKEILVSKRTKKGERFIDIKPDFARMEIAIINSTELQMKVVLQSSNEGSINPKLLFDAYGEKYGETLYPQVVRTNFYNENREPFL